MSAAGGTESVRQTASDLRISVVVCTRDREAYLERCLESLLSQTLPASHYEIVVVDNGSRPEATPAVLGRLGATRVLLRLLREPQPGLARARNRGWRSSRADLVAFLDDDAVASPRWLERILRAFDEVTPRPGCVGGRVEGLWEAPRPDWLEPSFEGTLSLVDWSDTPGFLSEKQWQPGCNMAFPRALLELADGFPPDLGRRGERLLSMEETALHERLREIGHGLYYDPLACVGHAVPAERMTRRWLARRIFWNGVSRALRDRSRQPRSARGRLTLAWRGLRRHVLQARHAARLCRAGPDRFSAVCVTLGWVGYALGVLGLLR